MRRCALAATAALVAVIRAAGMQPSGDGVAPETLLLARIKLRAAENLSALPNYTCLETIERSRRRAAARRFEFVDLLRLEVAFVNNKELFAWPGSEKFEERELSEIVGGGTIGTGSFALHARSVFLSRAPTFTHVGERFREGRRTIRYDYRVPAMQSGYRLKVPPKEGIVGYEGSFWVDAETLDLIWLEVRVTEIPPHLPVSSATEFLEYARTPIGERSFLLPKASELVIVDLAGNESRNRIRFTGCRQFAGESTLSFGEPPEPPQNKWRPVELQLPEGLDIELRLDSPIETGVSAVGDPIRATVLRDVKRRGAILAPKGAVAHGRLVHLKRRDDARRPGWIAGVQFDRIEFGDFVVRFAARMDPVGENNFPLGVTDFSSRSYRIVREANPSDIRVGILYIKGEQGKVPAGARMIWRTVAVAP